MGVCEPDSIDNLTVFTIGKVGYFYQPCVGNDNDAAKNVRNCHNCYLNYSNRTVGCFQFCENFETVLPPIYFSLSCLSALCCLGVFVTYFSLPRLRRSGYSSKVFLYRQAICMVCM